MTIQDKMNKLYQAFLVAWDEYKKIEAQHSSSTGFGEHLSKPVLKNAYQKWQLAVSDYYDFARSVETRQLDEQAT